MIQDNATKAETSHRMPQLDGLRALAVLLVVWSHWAPIGKNLGVFGVQMFFVLSGFLISGILFDARPEKSGRTRWFILRQFYARRFLRIFPLFYLVIAVAVLLNFPPFGESWPWHAPHTFRTITLGCTTLNQVMGDIFGLSLWRSSFISAGPFSFFSRRGDFSSRSWYSRLPLLLYGD